MSTGQIESAFLQGTDVERAVLAMIRAKQTGVSLDWRDVIVGFYTPAVRFVLGFAQDFVAGVAVGTVLVVCVVWHAKRP